MILENMKANEDIKPNSKEIELLKQNFPRFFDKDGQFLLNRFQEILKQSDITLNKEGYELNFLGKSYARYQSSTKTETFLSPDIEHNSKEENKDSENLYIVGDNLDALKHLLGSYAGKIKCIYIDPPYNTGEDGFVYPDNFKFNAKELSNVIGIEEDEAERIINLSGKSSHSAWLTFMYPRLILARELLADDGVIFISIDDNELNNLKLICDELFGENNYIDTFSWQKTTTPANLSKLTKKSIEYILGYRKSFARKSLNGIKKESKSSNGLMNQSNKVGVLRFPGNFVDTGLKDGVYLSGDYGTKAYKIKLLEDVEVKNGLFVSEVVLKGKFKWSQQYLEEQITQGTKISIRTDAFSPSYEKSEYEVEAPWNILNYKSNVGTNENASELLDSLLGNDIFNNPKPVSLINFLINTIRDPNSIILDFFSGSASTAHAVMDLNRYDLGNRKYIMVQLPEIIKVDKPAYKAGYRTIDEIGRERIKRAAAKIKDETGADIDYGFKTYYLETLEKDVLTNIDIFDDQLSFKTDDMIGIYDTEHSKGKDSILSTYLVLDDYGLSSKTEEYKLQNYKADLIDKSLYIIDEGLKSEDVMELIKRIESLELDLNRVVAYVHKISFSVLQELKKNLANLRNNKNVELIERY